MKRMKFFRLLTVFSLLLVALFLFVSCAGTVDGSVAPETTSEVTLPETTEPACLHEHRTRSVQKVATCSEEGVEIYVCDACGAREEKETPIRHFYEESYDALTGQTLSECVYCGIRGYLVGAGESLTLSGRFGGDVHFSVQAAFGEGEVKFWVDDDLQDTVSFWDETVSLDAEGLANTEHEFYFDNVGDNDVLIDATELTSKLCAVIVERLPANGQTYNSVNVYVRTSDPSGDYYIRYRLQYEYSDVRNNYNRDSGTNRSNYRIKTAQLVKITELKDTEVVARAIFEVLTSGEISLAANQKNPVWSKLTDSARNALGNGTAAKDQVGGFHGDERLQSAVLSVDGEALEIFGQTEGLVLPCVTASFDQTTTIYAWGTSTATSFGWAVMEHTQAFTFDADGVRNRKSIEWLDDGYETGAMFFHMFTMRRQENGKAVCEIVETYDASGNRLGKQTLPLIVNESGNTYLGNTKGRSVRYSSATSGVSAETGFRILNGSAMCNSFYVMARDADNKLYVSFASAKNGSRPKKGEVWEVEVYYTIDYVAPEAGNK